ncbi:MAG: anti-sigma factor domain-containing protein [Clostridiales bacterium]|nr:anti-sigma factor domain-containing protein [Clostridiales bacterium]
MSKGTILSIENMTATVMTEDCRLINVNAQPGMMVGEEIDMKMNNETARAPYARKTWIAAVAAAVALAVLGSILLWNMIDDRRVYARISVDVNPSVEFSLNRDLTVVAVKAMNEDAKAYLENQEFAGMAWQKAVDKWVEILRESNRFEMEEVLISGVFPEEAVKLQEQLLLFEKNPENGEMRGLTVRVIYSTDPEVMKQAQTNELSVGRQMLLNQSKEQNKEWNEENIGGAKLGELTQALLGEGEQNQTKENNRGEDAPKQSGDPTGEGAIVTNQEKNGEPQNGEPTAQQTNQEQNRETQSSSQASGSTVHETNRETNQEPAGSTARQTAKKAG